jgi:hypothetical protein
MRTDRVWSSVLLVCLGLGALAVAPANAKTYAYVISPDRTVLKIDTDTDTVVSRQTLQGLRTIASDGGDDFYVSGPDNLMLASYYTSTTKGDVSDFRIAAFELRTLTFKKDLGIVWTQRPGILIPPTGPHFFVLWFDPTASSGQGGQRVTRYDKATLTAVGDLPSIPRFGGRFSFSRDGSRLLALYSDPTDMAVQVLDAGTLQLLATVRANLAFAPGRWGGDIEDIEGDRALLVENLKAGATDPNRYTLFTLHLPDGTASPRISTGMMGRAYLSLEGDRIILSETQDVLDAQGNYDHTESVGRLHVYDVATGAKLGQVTVPARDAGDVWAIHPRGDKVYYRSRTVGDQDYTVAVVSLSTFSLVKELKLPDGPIFFIEENP